MRGLILPHGAHRPPIQEHKFHDIAMTANLNEILPFSWMTPLKYLGMEMESLLPLLIYCVSPQELAWRLFPHRLLNLQISRKRLDARKYRHCERAGIQEK